MKFSCTKFFLFFIFQFCFTVSFAQVTDSLYQTLSKKPKLTGGVSTRYSFVTGFATSVRCASLGAEFANKLRTGIQKTKISYRFIKTNISLMLQEILIRL